MPQSLISTCCDMQTAWSQCALETGTPSIYQHIDDMIAAHRTCADPPSAPEPSRGMCYPTRLPVPLQAPHHRIEVRIRAPSESHLPAARAWRLWQGLHAEQRKVRGCRRPERDGPRFSPGRCAFRLVAHARASTSNRWTCRPPAQRGPGLRFDVADCGHHMRDCCVQHGRFALVVR